MDIVERERLQKFEELNLQLPQVDLQTRHYQASGLYAREIFIPAGTALTGAAHKTEHLNICDGDITVWTEDGLRRITGHLVMVSRPGTKRAGFAHADTWWTTIHATTETDIEKIEDELTDEAPMLQTRCLGLPGEPKQALEE